MSIKKMLIDATHPEETRVVVMNGNRLEDFDVESESRKQIKGNIYLAKVIRVEPSLQAAFVDYGGNRHGFLAFSEIHPDYYQVPIEDRQALLEEYKAAEISEDSAADNGDHDAPEIDVPDEPSDPTAKNGAETVENDAAAAPEDVVSGDDESDEADINEHRNAKSARNAKGVETLGGDDTDDARPARKILNYRRYKIQEVVKRRQILLIQVVKEERGNKGAALTTYISLAGRYCVLMPNTARGGGISRKITSGADRKQLKAILTEMEIPDGMAVIVRTAGIQRSRSEIKRDYEYLMRLWDSVRELTLKSTAPALVHEEGNLIKRSIRDLYGSDVEDIVVAGDAGYRMAKDFIKLLIPSHAKRVQPYRDEAVPLFKQFQVESQLDAIHSPEVHMKTGSYIVINPTEALVSIDVNSGRSTRERNIEETALKTNLEAADEIARQLRLRDLAGLIVIDFIDMEVTRNNGLVERRLKDAMRNDRARIQIGRISPFGLLELSRQRLRMSLIETSSEPCQHCGGTGVRRSTDASALVALRAIEEEAMRKQSSEFAIHVPSAIALYILNQKRSALTEIETRYEISVTVDADDTLVPPDLRLERIKGGSREVVAREAGSMIIDGDDKPAKRRRRRSRNRKSSDDEGTAPIDQDGETEAPEGQDAHPEETDADGEDANGKRRRRGKRGGRRRGSKPTNQADGAAANDDVATSGETVENAAANAPGEETPEAVVTAETEGATDEVKPARRPRRSRAKKPAEDSAANEAKAADAAEEPVAEAVEKPKRVRRPRKKADAVPDVASDKPSKAAPVSEITVPVEVAPPADTPKDSNPEAAKTTVVNIGDAPVSEDAEKPKRGWWRR